MQRSRNKGKRAVHKNSLETRTSARPFVIVCTSAGNSYTAAFCSPTTRWRVIVYNPDTRKWWDRLEKSLRVRVGPPLGELSHIMAIFNEEDDEQVHLATTYIGEQVDIASVALINPSAGYKEHFEMAMGLSRAVLVVDRSVSSHESLRALWAFQDANNASRCTLTEPEQIQNACHWNNLAWRWNGPRIRDAYLRLKHPILKNENNRENSCYRDELSMIHKNRRLLEKKAVLLLMDPQGKKIADYILGAAKDPFLFGRIHERSRSTAPENHMHIVAPPRASLDSHKFATSRKCSDMLALVRIVPQQPEDRFSIPLGNPVMTTMLLPAIFPLSLDPSQSRFDVSLGSRRIWPEHMALKASILYMFEGQPGKMRDLAIQVVQTALPKVWELLFLEPPDGTFLRALLHPDVMNHGRLRRLLGNTELLPADFEAMARIYTTARFVSTLRAPEMSIFDDTAIFRPIARAMKLSLDCVAAVVNLCKEGESGIDEEDCEEMLRINREHLTWGSTGKTLEHREEPFSPQARDILGMLGKFLHRDRQSMCDSLHDNNKDAVNPPQWSSSTDKTLIDCAMYCGTVKWVAGDDPNSEDGLWTCLICLHRWQKRRPHEAFQSRKLMHPMTLVPFRREDYHDAKEWDDIMEATGGEVSRLGEDYYWGRCSSADCSRVCTVIARSGACAETDSVPLQDFPETVTLHDGSTLYLRSDLATIGPLGPDSSITSQVLVQYFDSEEKLLYLSGPTRRRTRNCIDKSTYILPQGILCEKCSIPGDAVVDYCPYCGTGFEPIFACVHYSCPRCKKHFCKACLGIEGIHFRGVYNPKSHVCWRILRNKYSYANKGICYQCGKERPWPASHALVSAGPEIQAHALAIGGEMTLDMAVQMQSRNLEEFTKRYEEGVKIFERCNHTHSLGSEYCCCGAH